jgi:hypothetical protein
MVRAGCTATACAPAPRSSLTRHPSPGTQHCLFLIGSAAIKNPRIPLKPHAKFFSNRSKIASLRTHFAPLASRLSNHFSPQPKFLIGSRQLLEFDLTHSQLTRTHFLTGGFSALFSFSCLVKPFVSHSRHSLQRRDRPSSAHAPSSEPEWPRHRGSLTVARRSSKLLVSTGPAIRSSARAAINCEGEDRCRNALFSRMCGAAIKSTGFASA